MASTGPNRPYNGLPKSEFITLTEYITWELDGVARTDDQVTHLRAEALKHDLKEWWDSQGPQWLKPNLELIRDGKTWPPSKSGNTEVDEINRGFLTRASQWINNSGLQIGDALTNIENDLRQRAANEQSYTALEEFIWSEAAAEHVTLLGRRWNDNSRKPDSEYAVLPKTFFLRRAKYSCGNSFHGKGELVRWPNDDSEQGLLDSAFNNSDPPVTYVEIKISRRDALRLHQRLKMQVEKLEPEQPFVFEKETAPVSDPRRCWWRLETALSWIVARDEQLAAHIQAIQRYEQCAILSIALHIEGQMIASGAVLEVTLQNDRVKHITNLKHIGRFRQLADEFDLTNASLGKTNEQSLLDFLVSRFAWAWELLRPLIADGEQAARGTAVDRSYSDGRATEHMLAHGELPASAAEPLFLTEDEREPHLLWLAQGDRPMFDGTVRYWKTITVNSTQLLDNFPKPSELTKKAKAGRDQSVSISTQPTGKTIPRDQPGPKSKKQAIDEAAKKAFPPNGQMPTGLSAKRYRNDIREHFVSGVTASDKTFKTHGY